MSGELEAFGGGVFRKVLDLPLREEDLQRRAETLSLQTTQVTHEETTDDCTKILDFLL